MVRWLVGLFFITHGAIHWGVWFSTARRDAPFDPNHSWLLSALGVGKTGQQFVGIDLAALVGLGYLVAGVAWIAGAPWANAVAFWSTVGSLGLFALFFNVWLSAMPVIALVILYLLRR